MNYAHFLLKERVSKENSLGKGFHKERPFWAEMQKHTRVADAWAEGKGRPGQQGCPSSGRGSGAGGCPAQRSEQDVHFGQDSLHLGAQTEGGCGPAEAAPSVQVSWAVGSQDVRPSGALRVHACRSHCLIESVG